MISEDVGEILKIVQPNDFWVVEAIKSRPPVDCLLTNISHAKPVKRADTKSTKRPKTTKYVYLNNMNMRAAWHYDRHDIEMKESYSA
ncbi:hypothetical protein AC249_AIPGENE24838 [Exaiptasia diaphana]|nr:hypothetical protein AC249_AIPGENE24838 [Exaiptasia diaphana]